MTNHNPYLNLATWNIHMGVGSDGKQNLSRVAEVINALGSDLMALQEVDNRIGSDGDDLGRLQEWTSAEIIGGPTMRRTGGDYGNALLTRLPVLDVERHDLSVSNREPRGLLVAHVDWQGEELRVASTHLGLVSGERRSQVRRLIECLSAGETPLVLMGDFNEWLFWGRPLRWLRRHFGPFLGPATFPSRWPILRLDHILADPACRLVDREVFRSSQAREASDHLPVRAKFRKARLEKSLRT